MTPSVVYRLFILRREQIGKFWPKMDQNVADHATKQTPNLWEPVDQSKPYDPMDLDTDDVFPLLSSLLFWH